MKVGSLFAGIGGLDLGLERAGFNVIWQVEKDQFCRDVLSKHWRDIPQHILVEEVGAHNLEECDVICGGFPCQDISTAAPNAVGLAGARSGLWFEFARIIRELRPRYAVVENVPVLTTRGLDRVLSTLAEMGYDAEWFCVPASAFGAPHLRWRMFIVAYTECESLRQQQRGVGWASWPDPSQPSVDGSPQSVADSCGEGCPGGEECNLCEKAWKLSQRRSDTHGRCDYVRGRDPRRNGKGEPSGWWSIEPPVGRVADGVPGRVDSLRSLGNAVVPQIAEWIGHRIIAHALATERPHK